MCVAVVRKIDASPVGSLVDFNAYLHLQGLLKMYVATNVAFSIHVPVQLEKSWWIETIERLGMRSLLHAAIKIGEELICNLINKTLGLETFDQSEQCQPLAALAGSERKTADLSMTPAPKGPNPLYRTTRASFGKEQREKERERESYDSLLNLLLQPIIHYDGNIYFTPVNVQTLMATITIPSPSAFLDSPVIQPAPTPKVSLKITSKRRPSTKAHKTAAHADATTAKPKQTKSRDGM